MTTGGFGMQNIPGFGSAGVQLIGAYKLQSFIRRLVGSVRDIHPVLNIIGNMMRNEILSHFPQAEGETGYNSDGTAWLPLSPMTIALRRKGDESKNRDPMPLRDSGILYNSITFKIEGQTVYAGTNVDYAEKQQFGEGAIPPREFVWISDAKVEEMYNRLVNSLIASVFMSR